MQSPLSSLCDVLKVVKASATSYRDKLQANEAVTRAVLIDPVLRALGWDVANPANVEVEKPVSSGRLAGRLDYFLNTDNAEKPIVIEAKKLGESLEADFSQIATYACTLRIENLFLTDGLKWHHFTNISASNQTPTAKIDIGTAEGADLTKVAAFFVERLDAALYTPEKQNDIDNINEKIINLSKQITYLHKLLSETGIENPHTLAVIAEQETTNSQMPWLNLDGSWDAKKKKPAKFRLPDGNVVDVRSWTQILVEACKYCLAGESPLIAQLPIADRTGRATKLIDKTSPPSNLNSDIIVVGDTTLYVCTNYSANDCIANAAYMFNKLGDGKVRPAILLAE